MKYEPVKSYGIVQTTDYCVDCTLINDQLHWQRAHLMYTLACMWKRKHGRGARYKEKPRAATLRESKRRKVTTPPVQLLPAISSSTSKMDSEMDLETTSQHAKAKTITKLPFYPGLPVERNPVIAESKYSQREKRQTLLQGRATWTILVEP